MEVQYKSSPQHQSAAATAEENKSPYSASVSVAAKTEVTRRGPQ